MLAFHACTSVVTTWNSGSKVTHPEERLYHEQPSKSHSRAHVHYESRFTFSVMALEFARFSDCA
jgi:hypothetical protein